MAGEIARLFALAVDERLITTAEAKKLESLALKKKADLDEALGFLTRFHAVTAERASALRARVFAAPAPAAAPPAPASPPTVLATAPTLAQAPAPAAPAAPGPTLSVRAPGSDLVLAILPLGKEPSRELQDGYARVTGTSAYDARLRLVEPLPRLERVGPAGLVVPLADALSALGLSTLALPADLVLGQLQAFRVKRVESTEPFVVTGPDGPSLAAPVKTTTVDLSRRAFLVIGKYEYGGRVKVEVSRRRTGLIGAIAGGTRSHREEAVVDLARFAHLYLEGEPRPFELFERAIGDYEFLGSRRQATAKQNFQALLSLISSRPNVTTNDLLFHHAGRVKDLTTFSAGGSAPGLSVRVEGTATVEAADVLSRVLHQAWLRTLR